MCPQEKLENLIEENIYWKGREGGRDRESYLPQFTPQMPTLARLGQY